MLISSYKNVHDKQDKDIEIDNFLEGVRTGRWQDIALEVRNAPTKDIKDAIKKRAPLVTPSGSFAERKVDGLRKHSGFIAIDIDNLDDPAATKKRIGADPYLYACFISIRVLAILYFLSSDAFFALFIFFLANKYIILKTPITINTVIILRMDVMRDVFLNIQIVPFIPNINKTKKPMV